jgi:hypothetical protein
LLRLPRVPTFCHEILVELFRNRGDLVRELLACAHLTVPGDVAEVASVDLSQVVSTEYRADHVSVFRDATGVATLVVVVEIQRSIDIDKQRTWPVYLTAARASLRCPALLLIIAPDPRVARWARTPIDTGHPTFVLRPIVISYPDVPQVVDRQTALRSPELAVLSVLAHPREDVAIAALTAIGSLQTELSTLYFDVILAALPPMVRRRLEVHMERYEYQSEFARKYVAQGRQEGRQEGRQSAVLELARVKLGQMSPADEAAIVAVHDEAKLNRLIVELGRATDPDQARVAIDQLSTP